MAEHRSYVCDSCGHELNDAADQPGHNFLVLWTQERPSLGHFSTLVHVQPIIHRPHHFCGLCCLRDWAVSYKPESGFARSDWQQ